MTGQAIVAFVTLKSSAEVQVEKLEELRNHVAQKIGPIAKPANMRFHTRVRRHGAASCDGFYGTSPSTARWATRQRLPTPLWSKSCATRGAASKED